MRYRLALALLAALLPSVALAAPRGEPELTPEEQLDVDLAKLREELGKKHDALSRWAKGKKMKRTAHRHALLALHFDPDLRSVRSRLGYRKVGDGWVLKRPVDLEKLEDEEGYEEAYAAKDAELRTSRVRRLLALASDAKKAGLDARAVPLLVRAHRIDPQNPEARKALGHQLVAGRWFDPDEAAALPPQIDLTNSGGPSPIATSLGLQLVRYRSGRFELEGAADAGEFRFVLEAVRRADSLGGWYLSGARSGALPIAQRLHALGVESAFERWVDQSSGLDATGKSVAKQVGIAYSSGAILRSAPLSGNTQGYADWWIHGIGRDWLVRRVGRRVPAWLLSGLTDQISERCVGSMITRFFVVESSAGLQLSAGKGASASWRRQLRDLALLKEDPKTGILFSSAITGMTTADVMKAWSLVGNLIERDRAAFQAFVEGMGEMDGTRALQEAFGLTPDTLDEEWRAYVIEHG